MLATIAAVAAVVGGVVSAVGAKKEAAAQKAAAKQQIYNMQFQGQEERRVMLREQQYIEGEITANIGASNIQNTGSANRWQKSVRQEHRKQMGYGKAVEKMNAKSIRMGMPTNSATNLAAASSLLSGVSAGVGAYSQAKSGLGGGGEGGGTPEGIK